MRLPQKVSTPEGKQLPTVALQVGSVFMLNGARHRLETHNSTFADVPLYDRFKKGDDWYIKISALGGQRGRKLVPNAPLGGKDADLTIYFIDGEERVSRLSINKVTGLIT